MKLYIRQIVLLCLLLLSAGIRAQEVVGPDGPDGPSTGNKTITVVQAAGGRISPAGNSDGKVTVKGGTDQSFTIMATGGYEIGSILVDGQPLIDETIAGSASYTYTFINITEDHTLTAIFNPVRFDLTASAGKGGSIVPTFAQVVKGESQTFTITPDEGYEIAGISLDGISQETVLPFILTNVIKNHAVSVEFKGQDCLLTWNEIEHGTLTVYKKENETATEIEQGKAIPYGTELEVTVTPDEGYELSTLTVNGMSLKGNTFIIKGNTELKAELADIVCNVTVKSPEGGKLTVTNGQTALLPGTHRIAYGTQLELTQEAVTGYEFKAYSIEPADALSGTVVTVKKDLSIGASFAVKQFAVTVTAPEASDGTLTIDGASAVTASYDYGTVLILGNTAGEGKLFDMYTVEPVSALSGNKLTVTGEISLGIRFKDATNEPDGPYTVTYASPLIVKDGNNASVANGGKVAKGTLLTLLAANTNTQRLTSLTANGNPVDFLTAGDLNTAVYEVDDPVTFALGMERNTFPVVVQVPEGGVLEASIGGTAIVSGERYPYGSVVAVKATPNEGYTLTRILAGGQDITVSRSVRLTEDLLLSVLFTRDEVIGTNPDPGNPDPDAPLGIDLTPQAVTYNREIQSFIVRTLPGGITEGISVTYYLDGKTVVPREAGVYDVKLKRPADGRLAAFEQLVKGGLTISRATPQITKIDYTEEQVAGLLASTTATLKGGLAVWLSKKVNGTFTWNDPSAEGDKLKTDVSGYRDIIFTPDDQRNYNTASGKVYLQVAGKPGMDRRITLTAEEGGEAAFYNGDMSCPDGTVFYDGMALTLKAEAAAGYCFKGFDINGTLYSSNPYALTVATDLVITARFEKKKDPLSPTDGLQVKVTPPSSFIYDGKSKQVSVSSTPPVEGWQVEYRDKDDKAVIPVNAGTYRVIISRDEDDRWLAYQAVSSLVIEKATPKIVTLPVAGMLVVGALLEDAVLEAGLAEADGFGVVPGSFAWSEPRTTVTGDSEHLVRFSPSDAENFFPVVVNIEVKTLPTPQPVVITYEQPTGGTLIIKSDDDGKTIASGSIVTSGTKVRIETKANEYFRFEKLLIGKADYTVDALGNQGVVVREIYTSANIEARFVRTSYPPDPDDPDNPDEPDIPDTPGIPDVPDTPDPGPSEFTVWVRSTGLGTVTPGTTTVEKGGSLNFVITPGHSQQLADVRLNGNSVGAVTRYNLQNIQGNTTVEAVFCNIGILVYTLNSRTVGKGGFVTPGCVRVPEGSNHQFIIHTEKNNLLEKVEVGTEKTLKPVGKPGSYIFSNVKGDSVLVATFGIPTDMKTITIDDGTRLYSIRNCLYVHPSVAFSVLRIYRMNGQLFRLFKLLGDRVVSSLPDGIYVAELDENGQVLRRKVSICQ